MTDDRGPCVVIRGRPKTNPDLTTTTVALTPTTLNLLRRWAEYLGVSRSEVVRKLIEKCGEPPDLPPGQP